MEETIVIALGGNALLRPQQRGTYAEQLANVAEASCQLAGLVRQGYSVLVTHGNGPQVGALEVQNEEAAEQVPPLPLDAEVAEAQGLIGYLLQQCLENELGDRPPVVAMLTQVVVDPHDPAFAQPARPIGPELTPEAALHLILHKGYSVREDADHGWRRVVASPEPVELVEAAAIRLLVATGAVVIAAGGGGIPVVRRGAALAGVDAAVDSDLTAELLAVAVGAHQLVMATDVPQVSLNYQTPDERPLDVVRCSAAEEYLRAGHFPPGNMGPKVTAAVRFLRHGGRVATVCSLDEVELAVAGRAGTRFLPDLAAVPGSTHG